ncbi:MAG: hypothetical protein ABIT38_17965 [Gemmatimonadaceae bacterium]
MTTRPKLKKQEALGKKLSTSRAAGALKQAKATAQPKSVPRTRASASKARATSRTSKRQKASTTSNQKVSTRPAKSSRQTGKKIGKSARKQLRAGGKPTPTRAPLRKKGGPGQSTRAKPGTRVSQRRISAVAGRESHAKLSASRHSPNGTSSTSTLTKRRSTGSLGGQRTKAQRDVQIKELDPLAVCGPHTSVKYLFRLREFVDGVRRAHLVFYDRHGWYCEHGRGCHAVFLVHRAFPHLTK